MDALRLDIGYDWLEEMMGADAAANLKERQDITEAFADDIARPLKAIVIVVSGPGGGNPFVELTFQDGDHAWEWASSNMDMTPEDFEFASCPAA
jgi:hypothetical protein